MTLERIEHKVFASEAPLEEMGQFGSALATTKLNTKDVAEIQALPAYTKGWGSAIISENNYPAMEEMNGVLNVMSYHTGYLYQEGIPVYSSTQTYSTTSMVKSLDGKSIYRSLKADNKGNPLEDGTSWELFDFSKGTLRTNQLTNCILEIPQRIKYTLENGTLTIKAGSVVIVPYGTEDLSATYPVGATFINDNFKVYDTQFVDGKFFVWAEIQSDIDQLDWGEVTATNVLSIVSVNQNNFTPWLYSYSGDTTPTLSDKYALWFDTSANVIKRTLDKGLTWADDIFSMPVTINSYTSGKTSSVTQVFNGMGYIGSTVWVDKGVKGLIPNGRNEDGSLKNIEFVTDKVTKCDITAFTDLNTTLVGLLKNSDGLVAVARSLSQGEHSVHPTPIQYASYYNKVQNKWYICPSGTTWVEMSYCNIGNLKLSRTNDISTVSSLQPKQPVNLATKDMVDGQWVNCQYIIAKDVACPTVNKTYDVSSILPNDGYIYELLCDVIVKTGTTSGSTSSIGVSSDILGSNAFNVCAAKATSSVQAYNTGCFSIPVGNARQLMLAGYGHNAGTFTLCARLYRRLGTNL